MNAYMLWSKWNGDKMENTFKKVWIWFSLLSGTSPPSTIFIKSATPTGYLRLWIIDDGTSTVESSFGASELLMEKKEVLGTSYSNDSIKTIGGLMIFLLPAISLLVTPWTMVLMQIDYNQNQGAPDSRWFGCSSIYIGIAGKAKQWSTLSTHPGLFTQW